MTFKLEKYTSFPDHRTLYLGGMVSSQAMMDRLKAFELPDNVSIDCVLMRENQSEFHSVLIDRGFRHVHTWINGNTDNTLEMYVRDARS